MDYLKKTAKKIFQYEAQIILKKYRPKIIAISGSVGKTLAKEAIYLVLSKEYFVRKSEKSFTAELGVPLTIMGSSYGVSTPLELVKNILWGLLPIIWKVKYPEWLILEMDGDKPGDLSFVSSLLSIDILVMTAIGEVPSHVESFSDTENFLSEKRHIINALKMDGVIIYNIDDSQTFRLLQNADSRKISCGTGAESDVAGTEYKILYGNGKSNSVPTGMSFSIIANSNSHEMVVLESIGVHNEYACLLSVAVGLEL